MFKQHQHKKKLQSTFSSYCTSKQQDSDGAIFELLRLLKFFFQGQQSWWHNQMSIKSSFTLPHSSDSINLSGDTCVDVFGLYCDHYTLNSHSLLVLKCVIVWEGFPLISVIAGIIHIHVMWTWQNIFSYSVSVLNTRGRDSLIGHAWVAVLGHRLCWCTDGVDLLVSKMRS